MLTQRTALKPFNGEENLWTSKSREISEVDALELPVLCADGAILTVLHRGILLHEIGIGIATFEHISARQHIP